MVFIVHVTGTENCLKKEIQEQITDNIAATRCLQKPSVWYSGRVKALSYLVRKEMLRLRKVFLAQATCK